MQKAISRIRLRLTSICFTVIYYLPATIMSQHDVLDRVQDEAIDQAIEEPDTSQD